MQRCDQPGCTHVSRQQRNVARHLWEVHDIDLSGVRETYACDQPGCTHVSKRRRNLTRHLWVVHDIDTTGAMQTFRCDWPGCTYTSKQRRHVTRHQWDVHDMNPGGTMKTFACEQPGCEYVCKQRQHLAAHLESIHDVGEYECDFCLRCRNSCIRYTRDGRVHRICRECHRKATNGCESRKELVMLEFLRRQEYGHYIVLHDKALRGGACQTRRRPDVLIASSDELHLIVECDERQHASENYKCEEGRMAELVDEFPRGRVVFIRWNPDAFRLADGRRPVGVTLQYRLERLDAIIRTVLQDHGRDPRMYLVYYMFYSADNPTITRVLPYVLVY